MEIELTAEEEKAIRALRRLAKTWPKTLWLFSTGTLNVVRYNSDGIKAMDSSGSVDADYIVASIQGIENDGGDF
jgi:hypothetical protein